MQQKTSPQSVLKQISQLRSFLLLVNNVLVAVRHGALTVHLLLSPLATKAEHCFRPATANKKVEANQSKQSG